MVRKEAFFEIGMYDENFNSGEDTDMSLRARESSVKICYYPEISILHYHRTKLSSLVKQKILAGKNSYLLRKKWQGLFYRGSFKETIYLILEPFIIAIKSFLNAKSSEELFVFPFFIFALSVFQSFGFILGALENRSIKKECLFR